jgi:hypothetical protein
MSWGARNIVVVVFCKQKVAGSTPDEGITFFSIYLILPTTLEAEKFSGEWRAVCKGDNLTTICEPIV